MIDSHSFKNKAIKRFFKGDHSKVAPDHIEVIGDILDVMQAGTTLSDVDLPGLRLHPWANTGKGKDRVWSLDVSGPVRILFQVHGGYFFNIDYENPH